MTVRVSSAVICIALFACADNDTSPPPAPVVEPWPLNTADTHLELYGFAEYGSKVRISGGQQNTEVDADPFSARFHALVPLQQGALNTLTVIAVDRAGNASNGTTVTVEQDSLYTPAQIVASASSLAADIAAGETTSISISVDVKDRYGRPVPASDLQLMASQFTLHQSQLDVNTGQLFPTSNWTGTSNPIAPTIFAEGLLIYAITTSAYDAPGLYRFSFTHQPVGTVAIGSAPILVELKQKRDQRLPVIVASNLQANNNPCVLTGTPAACPVSGGTLVSFDVTVTDNVALSAVSFSAFFATQQVSRTQSQQVGGTSDPVQTTFTFTVPDFVGFEDVPVVVVAVDSSSNIATSSVFTLRVSAFNTTAGRVGSVAFQATAAVPFGDATDVVAMPTLNDFVVLDSTKLVRVTPNGTGAVYSGYNPNGTPAGTYLTRSASGDLFLSRGAVGAANVVRVGASVGNPVSVFLNGATNYAGISLLPARQARAMLNQNALGSGNIVIGGTTLTKGTHFTDDATLIAALANHPDVTASGPIAAGTCGAPNPCVLLTAKTAGAVITLSTTGNAAQVIAGTLDGSESIFISNGGTVGERYSINTPAPFAAGSSVLTSMTIGAGVSRGLAVRELPPSGLGEFITYAVSSSGADLRGTRGVQAGFGPTTSTTFFIVTGITGGAAFGAGGGAIHDVAYDTVSGCVAVSQPGSGQVLLVDVRDTFNVQPQVSVIASGMNGPNGLSFDAAGNLYVLENGRDRVVKIAPSPDPTDCF